MFTNFKTSLSLPSNTVQRSVKRQVAVNHGNIFDSYLKICLPYMSLKSVFLPFHNDFHFVRRIRDIILRHNSRGPGSQVQHGDPEFPVTYFVEKIVTNISHIMHGGAEISFVPISLVTVLASIRDCFDPSNWFCTNRRTSLNQQLGHIYFFMSDK